MCRARLNKWLACDVLFQGSPFRAFLFLFLFFTFLSFLHLLPNPHCPPSPSPLRILFFLFDTPFCILASCAFHSALEPARACKENQFTEKTQSEQPLTFACLCSVLLCSLILPPFSFYNLLLLTLPCLRYPRFSFPSQCPFSSSIERTTHTPPETEV